MTARFLGLSAALLLMVGTLSGDDKKKDGQPDMEAMMKFGAPGEAHQLFERFAGKWNFTGKWYMPGAPAPMDIAGNSEAQVIMGGRFLSDHSRSADDGKSFEGRGWWGYDNSKKKYWFSWIDTMATYVTVGEGKWDAKANTMTWTSEIVDPMTNKPVKMRETAVVKGDTIQKTFWKNDGSKEFKEMEMTFTRAK